MRRLLVGLLLFLSITPTVVAQSGYYYQTHFTPIENKRDQINYSIQQDDFGRLYFANRQGLLQFDGTSWDLIETPGPTFSISLNDSIIYLAGTYGFGMLTTDGFGNLTFKSLNDSSSQTLSMTQLISYGEELVMTDGKSAFAYDPSSKKLEKIATALPVTQIGVFDSKLVAFNADTTFLIKGQGVLPSRFVENGPWLGWSESASNQWIGANRKNELYQIVGGQLVPLKLDDEGYLEEARILSVTWMSDDLVAVGTLRGGVVFVDVKGRKLDQIVNFHTGLPDNETQTLFRDKDTGLWVAHPYGYTRVSPNIPFKSYNYYPGLDGTLYTSRHFDERVFAGTNLGLFYLDQVKNFDEIVYYIKKNPDTQLTVADDREEDKKDSDGLFSFFRFNKKDEKVDETTKEPVAEEEPEDDKKKKGGLFSFLKKNKGEEDKEEEKEEPEAPKKAVVASAIAKARSQIGGKKKTATAEPVMVRRVKKELQSITYVYKKIKGVEGRINQLVPINDDEMMAAGLAGVFIVKEDAAVQIYSEAVRRVFYDDAQNLILISTYRGGLLTVVNEDGKWKETILLENVDDFIQFIFKDRTGKIWLCTSQKLYWAKIENNTLVEAGEVPIKNDYLDPVMGIDDANLGVVFMHAKGFFKLTGDTLEKFDWLGMSEPSRYISSAGHLLVSDGRFWHKMGSKTEANGAFTFLNLFDHIVSIDFEKDGDLWVVTADNNFYRIDHNKAFEANYNPFLKHIRSVNNQLLPIDTKLRVEQENSSLSFFYHQTEYSGILKIEYRYRLLGLNEQWSEWSLDNNTIQFSYLPSDKYELQIETRNSFGVVKPLESIFFTVVPPYWQRPWFYAAEFLFFAMLLFLSSRLTKSDRMVVLVLNRLLTFLTIIMIIEFIQTIVEANFETDSSPVLSFFLQVAVAFCLMPLESFMRSKLSGKGEKVDRMVQGHVSKLTRGMGKQSSRKKTAEEQS
ncbi:MAG: hypothetical protein RIF36_01180 [Imperialibacter sp.]|uniref:triple tyrosine motif-containing protein n=1 Tax=Imperialibacter sp. TaxID=2038411 RepID=UPI0032F00C30